MKTILIASSKGGAGKTTLATNLAAYFALDGKRTVLVDADPQHSSTRWAERRAELESAVLPIDASGRRACQDLVDRDNAQDIVGIRGAVVACYRISHAGRRRHAGCVARGLRRRRAGGQQCGTHHQNKGHQATAHCRNKRISHADCSPQSRSCRYLQAVQAVDFKMIGRLPHPIHKIFTHF